jgi:hypothetical protein
MRVSANVEFTPEQQARREPKTLTVMKFPALCTRRGACIDEISPRTFSLTRDTFVLKASTGGCAKRRRMYHVTC